MIIDGQFSRVFSREEIEKDEDLASYVERGISS